MSMQYPIADMLTQIRNGQAAQKQSVVLPTSKLKVAIATVLQEEGYLEKVHVVETADKPMLQIDLKYRNGKAVIDTIKCVSKPGLRIYRSYNELPKVLGGLGIAIISTPKGVMTGQAAYAAKVGGEVLCLVS